MTESIEINADNASFFSLGLRNMNLKERNINHTVVHDISDLTKWYTIGEVLGRGVFGTVTEVIDNVSQKIWALKIVDKMKMKRTRENALENEIKILKIVNHPHIIYLDRTFESAKCLYMIFERCSTDLGTILKQKEKFTENETRKIIKDLSSALAYLHKYEIVHRDLKLENILTAKNPNDPGDELYIKISDFGLAINKCITRSEQMLKAVCGTLLYMAPEIISGSSYSKQCDVWSMGIVAYTLLHGKPPFSAANEKDLARIICKENPSFSTLIASTEAKDLLTKMLTKNVVLRISASEVERHPWIQGKCDSAMAENIFDVLKLWRTEMERPVEIRSPWAKAFSNNETSRQTADDQADTPCNDHASETDNLTKTDFYTTKAKETYLQTNEELDESLLSDMSITNTLNSSMENKPLKNTTAKYVTIGRKRNSSYLPSKNNFI